MHVIGTKSTSRYVFSIRCLRPYITTLSLNVTAQHDLARHMFLDQHPTLPLWTNQSELSEGYLSPHQCVAYVLLLKLTCSFPNCTCTIQQNPQLHAMMKLLIFSHYTVVPSASCTYMSYCRLSELACKLTRLC